MAKEEEFQDLFLKYTTNTIDKKEYERFLELLADTDLKERFKSLINGVLSGEESSHDQECLQASIDRVDVSIFQYIYKPEKIRIKAKVRWMSYAAGLLLFVSAGFYMLWQHQVFGPDRIAHQDVAPGGNRATLRFSDGRVYQLNEKEQGVVVSGSNVYYEDGETIANTGNLYDERIVIETPRGGQYRVTLPDGTKVMMNAQSRLSYPAKFKSSKREVNLEGEAYFDVVHQPDKPFVVKGQGQTVQVLGTKFNVSDYPHEQIKTTLIQGRVNVVNALSNKKELLLPGQQSIISGMTTNVKKVDTRDYIAWTTDVFSFNDMLLSDILRHLERWYDVDVVYAPEFKDKRFFAEIPRNRVLSSTLAALASYGQVSFEQQGRRVIVK